MRHSYFILSIALLPFFAFARPPVLEQMEKQGVNVVTTFDAPDDMTGYVLDMNGQGLTGFATKDDRHFILGALYDENGVNLSEQLVQQHVTGPLLKKQWGALGESTYIQDGDADAPQIAYMFTDPNCPYCKKVWRDVRPWVNGGQLQIRHIMVGILRPDSATKAAALLSADDPSAALTAFESASGTSTLPAGNKNKAGVMQELNNNLSLMTSMGISATPAIIYKQADGRIHRQMGAPDSATLTQMFGEQK